MQNWKFKEYQICLLDTEKNNDSKIKIRKVIEFNKIYKQ